MNNEEFEKTETVVAALRQDIKGEEHMKHVAWIKIRELSLGNQLAAVEKERDALLMGLKNCRLLAARHRKEDWALLILGFCAEAGVVGSVTR
jgi:hypothetical protein